MQGNIQWMSEPEVELPPRDALAWVREAEMRFGVCRSRTVADFTHSKDGRCPHCGLRLRGGPVRMPAMGPCDLAEWRGCARAAALRALRTSCRDPGAGGVLGARRGSARREAACGGAARPRPARAETRSDRRAKLLNRPFECRSAGVPRDGSAQSCARCLEGGHRHRAPVLVE